MKSLLFFLLACTITASVAQTTNNSICIGTVDSLYSTILKQERKVFVYVPENFGSIYAKQKYPVVYLFDGEAHFHSVTGLIQQLSQVNGNNNLPEMIVVGIPNIDRTHDLTPTPSGASAFLDSAMSATSGGGENFTAFIEKELIPYIDSHYPTTSYRVLIGHSLGGLMIMNTFLNHTNLFNAYLSIDPSMWWDNERPLKQAQKDLAEKKYDGKKLFVAMANTMRSGMDTLSLRKDTSANQNHPRAVLELGDALRENKKNHLQWNWKYYNDDTHGSVPLIAEHDALRWFFSFNKFMLPFVADEMKTFNYDSALTSHYKIVSAEMGYTVSPPEQVINDLAYQYLQQKNFDKAFHYFEMNIANYPESFNVYDSMGDYYDARGDKQKAIEYYTKALKHGDFIETKTKLEKLKSSTNQEKKK